MITHACFRFDFVFFIQKKKLSINFENMSGARVPYVYPPEGESEIADEIRSRRKGGQLTELDGVLQDPHFRFKKNVELTWLQVERAEDC